MHQTTYSRRFYILGCQRSGTTLMRLILETHPEIFCYDEILGYEILRNKTFSFKPGLKNQKQAKLVGFKIPRWTEQLCETEVIDSVEHSGASRFYLREPIIFLLPDTVSSMLALVLPKD